MKKIGILLLTIVIALPALAATKTVALDVKGWTCGSCAVSTRIALKKLEGVDSVKTDREKGEVVVTYDDSRITPQRMIEGIERIGYSATVKAVVEGFPSTSHEKAEEPVQGPKWLPEEVSFFKVPLECGAAADLGCGSAAKPILRQLEQDDRIASAKINHPGTLLAVAWKEPKHAPSGIPFVTGAFEKIDSEAMTLAGAAREKALKEYKAEKWYGPAEVDRLSEREAAVIASRLVTRAHLGLAPEVEKALTRDLSVTLARHLTSDPPSDRAIVEDDLVKASDKYLSPSQMEQLRKAGEQGVMALPGEAK